MFIKVNKAFVNGPIWCYDEIIAIVHLFSNHIGLYLKFNIFWRQLLFQSVNFNTNKLFYDILYFTVLGYLFLQYIIYYLLINLYC